MAVIGGMIGVVSFFPFTDREKTQILYRVIYQLLRVYKLIPYA